MAQDPGPRGEGVFPQGQRQKHPLGRGIVFVDFGRGKVYAVTDDGDEVLTFDGLKDVVGRLCPTVIVMDSLPSRLQNTVAEIAKAGTAFLRLRKLKILSDERKSNGVSKSHENDVKLLKTLYHRHPDLFQPLFTSPEELEVRALTELWVELVGQRKAAKHTRTTTDNPVAVETHRTLKRLIEKLSEEIHEKALNLPLYRKAVEELGLKGPTLAYIVSHDRRALTTLPRDRLATRYAMCKRRWKRRPLRSRLLILLAKATVLHGHSRYKAIYEHYRQKGKKHWPAILRVAMRILRDLRQQTQKAGPPA